MFERKRQQRIKELQEEIAQVRLQFDKMREEKEHIEMQRNELVHERDDLKEYHQEALRKQRFAEAQRDGIAFERDELKEKEQLLETEKKELQNHCQKLSENMNRMTYNMQVLDKLHEDVVLRRWEKDNHLQQYTCLMPFEFIDIFSEGDVYCCCCDFVKPGYALGNIYEKSFDELWNCEKIKKLRYCVSSGDFEYCNSICATLHSRPEDEMNMVGTPPLQYRKDVPYHFAKYEECELKKGPKYIKLECDATCNLSCPSCRSQLKMLSIEESERVFQMLMEKVYPNLNDCEYLIGLNSGELLASRAMMKFYKLLSHEKFPKMKLMIYSNGMLLDEKHLSELSNLQGMPMIISVSVDAAEKETYERLRRGGRWDRLIENLHYVKRLAEQDRNISLRLNFCVQKDNYRQIPQFIELAKSVSAEIVALQLMTDWGTMSLEEFKEKNVIHEDNPCRDEALQLVQEAVETEGITVVTNIM